MTDHCNVVFTNTISIIFGFFGEESDVGLLLSLDDITDLQEQYDVASQLVQYELQCVKVMKIEEYDSEYETITFDVISQTTQRLHRCAVSGPNALKCAELKLGAYVAVRGGLVKGNFMLLSLTSLKLLEPPEKRSSRRRGKKTK